MKIQLFREAMRRFFTIESGKIREKREKDLFFTLIFVIIEMLMIQFETVFVFYFCLVINEII